MEAKRKKSKMRREEEKKQRRERGVQVNPRLTWENSRTGQGRRVFLGRWSHG